MPNHITNVIELQTEDFEKVKDEVMTNGRFDFEKLIPMPLDVYRGSVSLLEEKDFPKNWYNWSIDHWGTKWNAYDTCVEKEGKETKLSFLTAWGTPDPVIVAFANKTQVPFQYKYFDEGHGFFGHDAWGKPNRPWTSPEMSRLSHNYMMPEIYNSLCQELQGYHPNPPDLIGNVQENEDGPFVSFIVNDAVDPDDDR